MSQYNEIADALRASGVLKKLPALPTRKPIVGRGEAIVVRIPSAQRPVPLSDNITADYLIVVYECSEWGEYTLARDQLDATDKTKHYGYTMNHRTCAEALCQLDIGLKYDKVLEFLQERGPHVLKRLGNYADVAQSYLAVTPDYADPDPRSTDTDLKMSLARTDAVPSPLLGRGGTTRRERELQTFINNQVAAQTPQATPQVCLIYVKYSNLHKFISSPKYWHIGFSTLNTPVSVEGAADAEIRKLASEDAKHAIADYLRLLQMSKLSYPPLKKFKCDATVQAILKALESAKNDNVDDDQSGVNADDTQYATASTALKPGDSVNVESLLDLGDPAFSQPKPSLTDADDLVQLSDSVPRPRVSFADENYLQPSSDAEYQEFVNDRGAIPTMPDIGTPATTIEDVALVLDDVYLPLSQHKSKVKQGWLDLRPHVPPCPMATMLYTKLVKKVQEISQKLNQEPPLTLSQLIQFMGVMPQKSTMDFIEMVGNDIGPTWLIPAIARKTAQITINFTALTVHFKGRTFDVLNLNDSSSQKSVMSTIQTEWNLSALETDLVRNVSNAASRMALCLRYANDEGILLMAPGDTNTHQMNCSLLANIVDWAYQGLKDTAGEYVWSGNIDESTSTMDGVGALLKLRSIVEEQRLSDVTTTVSSEALRELVDRTYGTYNDVRKAYKDCKDPAFFRLRERLVQLENKAAAQIEQEEEAVVAEAVQTIVNEEEEEEEKESDEVTQLCTSLGCYMTESELMRDLIEALAIAGQGHPHLSDKTLTGYVLQKNTSQIRGEYIQVLKLTLEHIKSTKVPVSIRLGRHLVALWTIASRIGHAIADITLLLTSFGVDVQSYPVLYEAVSVFQTNRDIIPVLADKQFENWYQLATFLRGIRDYCDTTANASLYGDSIETLWKTNKYLLTEVIDSVDSITPDDIMKLEAVAHDLMRLKVIMSLRSRSRLGQDMSEMAKTITTSALKSRLEQAEEVLAKRGADFERICELATQ